MRCPCVDLIEDSGHELLVGVGRSLELDRIAVRILGVDGRALTLGTVAPLDRSRLDAMGCQMADDLLRIEGINAQADVIHVVAVGTGGRATVAAHLAIDRDKIDQRRPGAQLIEPELLETALKGTAQDITVKAQGHFDVADTQDNMIDGADLNHRYRIPI